MAKDFSKLSDILNESVLTVNKESWRFGQAFDKSMSCCMLFKFWKNVAGKKFEKLSIPYELKGATLFVSVMSPAVIQELSFFKKELIEKYAPYAEGLNLKITDIGFDYKNWSVIKASFGENNSDSKAFDTDIPDYYTQKDYETIGLDNIEEEEFEKLKKTIINIESMPPLLKEKMYNNALNQYKAQKLRKLPPK